MNTDVVPFEYVGQEVRTVRIDGESWFVAADVCAVLDVGRPQDSVRYLDDDERGRCPLDTPFGEQLFLVVSESGLYSLILRSRKPEAKEFKRWITREVLPSIRRTGGYAPVRELPANYAAALRELAEEVEARELAERKAAELEPAANSWHALASAEGDFAVSDAAKILSRDPVIKLGRNRLFTRLHQMGWLYRQGADHRYRVKQTAVERGWLSEIPASHYHPRTGELVLDPPQVRVTAKGLAELLKRLGGTSPLQLAS